MGESFNGDSSQQQQLDELKIKTFRNQQKKRNIKLTFLTRSKITNTAIKCWKSFMYELFADTMAMIFEFLNRKKILWEQELCL